MDTKHKIARKYATLIQDTISLSFFYKSCSALQWNIIGKWNYPTNRLHWPSVFRDDSVSSVNIHLINQVDYIWAASSEFGIYRLCEQRRFRRACASAQSRKNLRCSFIQAVSQEEPSDRKPDTWPLWMAGHAQLKFVMTECSKTQIRLTGLV